MVHVCGTVEGDPNGSRINCGLLHYTTTKQTLTHLMDMCFSR